MAVTTKKTRLTAEALPQLATLPERVAVLEVQVTNIDEKIDTINQGMCENQKNLLDTLKEMRDTSVSQHNDMAAKIKDLEGFKNKWIRLTMMGLAFAAGAGWFRQDLSGIIKFLGM